VKRNDAEPQRESRSVEDNKLTKLSKKKEKNVCRNPGLPRLLSEKRRGKREESEKPSNQSQWTPGEELTRTVRSDHPLDSISAIFFSIFRFFDFLFFFFFLFDLIFSFFF
jgi:hypothetical protein